MEELKEMRKDRTLRFVRKTAGRKEEENFTWLVMVMIIVALVIFVAIVWVDSNHLKSNICYSNSTNFSIDKKLVLGDRTILNNFSCPKTAKENKNDFR